MDISFKFYFAYADTNNRTGMFFFKELLWESQSMDHLA